MPEKKPAAQKPATEKPVTEKPATAAKTTQAQSFSAEEKAAMRERTRELRAGKQGGEAEVQAKIAGMTGLDGTLAQRLHALVREHAPALTPKLWYGMPAYARSGKVVCFFQSAGKFKTRYATLGFSDAAHLDDGSLWPTAYALTELNAEAEAKIAALIKRAAG